MQDNEFNLYCGEVKRLQLTKDSWLARACRKKPSAIQRSQGVGMMKDIPDLLDGLRRSPKILSEFVEDVPPNKLDLRRGDGFWTIAEHVSHLAQVQPMLLTRFEQFIHEDYPEFIPYIPGEDEEGADTP